MGQAVQAGGCQQGIAEEVGPFLWGSVAGEEDGAAFVPLVDDVVEVLRSGWRERLEPEVIERQQVGAQIRLEAPFQGTVGAPATDVLEHYTRSGSHTDCRYVGTVSARNGTPVIKWAVLRDWE